MIPITRRMALLVTTAALAPLLVFGLVAGRTLSRSTRDSVVETHRAIAARAASAIELYFDASQRLVTSAGADLEAVGLSRAQQNQVLRYHLHLMKEIKSITLFDGVFDGKDPEKYARSFPVNSLAG